MVTADVELSGVLTKLASLFQVDSFNLRVASQLVPSKDRDKFVLWEINSPGDALRGLRCPANSFP